MFMKVCLGRHTTNIRHLADFQYSISHVQLSRAMGSHRAHSKGLVE